MATFVVLRSRTMSSLVPAIGRRTITSLTQPVINGARSCSHLSRLNPCRSVVQPSTTLVRSFGIFGPDKTPLDIKMVESRVMKICGSYDKIDASSVFKIQKRHFSHGPPLTYDFIVERVMLVFELYEKVDKSKLKLDSHFANDLGLDSLDHVEVIMAIEDEFSFEIPDKDAEKLWTPADIIKYVADKEEAWRELQTEEH